MLSACTHYAQTHANVAFSKAGLSHNNRVKVRLSCDLGHESWYQKSVSGLPNGEIHMILRSLVLMHYQRVTHRNAARMSHG